MTLTSEEVALAQSALAHLAEIQQAHHNHVAADVAALLEKLAAPVGVPVAEEAPATKAKKAKAADAE